MSKIIVAIDGLSACGKSTLARDLATELGYSYIDTGAMYRAVTLYLLSNDIPITDKEQLAQHLSSINIQFRNIAGKNRTFLNGVDVEKDIRSLKVSGSVSEVAAISAVRRHLVALQQAMGAEKGLVMDGRDIGTVVFPNAELKIFLQADFNERAHRRCKELRTNGLSIDAAKIKENLKHRDHIDSTRADSPLRKAKDARILDNTHLTHEKQLEVALKWAEEAKTATRV